MSAIAVDPAGKLVATGRGLTSLEGAYADSADIRAKVEQEAAVKIWPVGADVPSRIIAGPATPVRALAWDPLGRFLAVVDAMKHLTLINPSDPQASAMQSLPDDTSALAIQPNGHALATGTSAGVRLFRIV